MNRKTKWIVGGAVAAALIAGAASFAVATGADDDDTPLTGSTLEQAKAAALAHTGGGEVVETEVGDGGAAYGVEIRLPDGSVVEVTLDSAFKVIGQEADEDLPGEEDEPDDD